LAKKYRILATGEGVWWKGHESEKGSSVHLLVGEYQGVPFEVSVEAMVILDEAGRVTEVLVRRTRNGI